MHLLDEAKDLTSGDRVSDYGPADVNHQRIAAIWSMLLGITVMPEQVALCMIGLKLARLAHTPDHRDSVIDIAGYAACWDKIRLARLASGAAG